MIKVRCMILLAAAGCMISASEAPAAVQAVSETYVSTAVTIRGAGNNSRQDTWFSLSMVKPFVAAGSVTALSSNSFTDSEAFWSNDLFNGSNGFFYAEFLGNPGTTSGGLMADILDTDGATGRITLNADPRSLVSVGTKYRIRPHFTFFGLFGRTNGLGLTGGPNNNTADIVQIQSKGKTPVTVFFWSYRNAYTNIQGWYTFDPTGYVPVQDFAIYPEQGIRICRRGVTDVVLYLQGQLKQTPTKVPVYPGNNALGCLKAFKSMSLNELNIYTGNLASGLKAGINPGVADTLEIIRPDNTPVRYFYFDNGNYRGWMDWEFNPPASELIPPGSAFVILRKTATPFIWDIPAE